MSRTSNKTFSLLSRWQTLFTLPISNKFIPSSIQKGASRKNSNAILFFVWVHNFWNFHNTEEDFLGLSQVQLLGESCWDVFCVRNKCRQILGSLENSGNECQMMAWILKRIRKILSVFSFFDTYHLEKWVYWLDFERESFVSFLL